MPVFHLFINGSEFEHQTKKNETGKNLNINLENLVKLKECKHLGKGVMVLIGNGTVICVGDFRIQQGKVFNTVLKTGQH